MSNKNVCSLLRADQDAQPANTEHLPPRVLLTDAYPRVGVKTATLRDMYFKSKPERHEPNGFAPAFTTLGRSIYVIVDKFHEIWDAQHAGKIGDGS